MATLSQAINQHWHNKNGGFAINYRLYAYESRTTTILDTYKDATETSKHTHPIIIQPNGKVPGEGIFLKDGAGVSYTFILKDEFDAEVSTVNDVTAASLSTEFHNFITQEENSIASLSDTSYLTSILLDNSDDDTFRAVIYTDDDLNGYSTNNFTIDTIDEISYSNIWGTSPDISIEIDSFTNNLKLVNNSGSDINYTFRIEKSDPMFFSAIIGADGADGEKGEKGDNGIQGPAGVQGIQGEQGDPGIIQGLVAGNNISIDNYDLNFPIINMDTRIITDEEIAKLANLPDDTNAELDLIDELIETNADVISVNTIAIEDNAEAIEDNAEAIEDINLDLDNKMNGVATATNVSDVDWETGSTFYSQFDGVFGTGWEYTDTAYFQCGVSFTTGVGKPNRFNNSGIVRFSRFAGGSRRFIIEAIDTEDTSSTTSIYKSAVKYIIDNYMYDWDYNAPESAAMLKSDSSGKIIDGTDDFDNKLDKPDSDFNGGVATWNTITETLDISEVFYIDSSGDLHINTNIFQTGDAYETHAEQLYTTKDIIITRGDAIVGMATDELTGIQAKLYDGTNDGFIGFDSDGVARVGDVGDLVALCGRDEVENLVDGHLLKWDDTNQILVDSDVDIAELVEAVSLNTSAIDILETSATNHEERITQNEEDVENLQDEVASLQSYVGTFTYDQVTLSTTETRLGLTLVTQSDNEAIFSINETTGTLDIYETTTFLNYVNCDIDKSGAVDITVTYRLYEETTGLYKEFHCVLSGTGLLTPSVTIDVKDRPAGSYYATMQLNKDIGTIILNSSSNVAIKTIGGGGGGLYQLAEPSDELEVISGDTKIQIYDNHFTSVDSATTYLKTQFDEDYVPLSRLVNDYSLSNDIILDAVDVSAVPEGTLYNFANDFAITDIGANNVYHFNGSVESTLTLPMHLTLPNVWCVTIVNHATASVKLNIITDPLDYSLVDWEDYYIIPGESSRIIRKGTNEYLSLQCHNENTVNGVSISVDGNYDVDTLSTTDRSKVDNLRDDTDADLTSIEGEVTTLSSYVATNATAIATNVTAIAANATAIAANATNIASNATAIAGNATAIASNVTAIAANATELDNKVSKTTVGTSSFVDNDLIFSYSSTNTDRITNNDTLNTFEFYSDNLLTTEIPNATVHAGNLKAEYVKSSSVVGTDSTGKIFDNSDEFNAKMGGVATSTNVTVGTWAEGGDTFFDQFDNVFGAGWDNTDIGYFQCGVTFSTPGTGSPAGFINSCLCTFKRFAGGGRIFFIELLDTPATEGDPALRALTYINGSTIYDWSYENPLSCDMVSTNAFGQTVDASDAFNAKLDGDFSDLDAITSIADAHLFTIWSTTSTKNWQCPFSVFKSTLKSYFDGIYAGDGDCVLKTTTTTATALASKTWNDQGLIFSVASSGVNIDRIRNNDSVNAFEFYHDVSVTSTTPTSTLHAGNAKLETIKSSTCLGTDSDGLLYDNSDGKLDADFTNLTTTTNIGTSNIIAIANSAGTPNYSISYSDFISNNLMKSQIGKSSGRYVNQVTIAGSGSSTNFTTINLLNVIQDDITYSTMAFRLRVSTVAGFYDYRINYSTSGGVSVIAYEEDPATSYRSDISNGNYNGYPYYVDVDVDVMTLVLYTGLTLLLTNQSTNETVFETILERIR